MHVIQAQFSQKLHSPNLQRRLNVSRHSKGNGGSGDRGNNPPRQTLEKTPHVRISGDRCFRSSHLVGCFIVVGGMMHFAEHFGVRTCKPRADVVRQEMVSSTIVWAMAQFSSVLVLFDSNWI